MLKIKSDKIIAGENLLDGFVYIDGGAIADVTEADYPAEDVYDYTGKYVSPGFIDMHTHGGGGNAFVNSSPQEVAAGCNFHMRHGTTTVLPTVSAAPFGVMRSAVRDIAAAKRDGMAKNNILGAHLEGPYLSKEQCGAQCPSFITPPKREEYEPLVQEIGDVARWTYAPEHDQGGAFCKYLTAHGIVASAGHTNATYDDMRVAMDSGCNLITHLYSCTSTVTRDRGFRRLGVIETAFLCDGLHVEIIADGKHLPPELIRLIVKIKGADCVSLITDSLAIAGTGVKTGNMSGTDFIVEDGVCKLLDRSAFAGSVATADKLVRVLTQECGFAIPAAVKMLTRTPARVLGLKKGVLVKGYDADIVVFDDNIHVSAVFVGGRKTI